MCVWARARMCVCFGPDDTKAGAEKWLWQPLFLFLSFLRVFFFFFFFASD